MSYVLHIWESPLPSTFEQAMEQALERGEDQVGQNPGFLVLAGRLTARYPCITQGGEVWSDGPLDGVSSDRCWVIGIADLHDEVIPFVTASANKLGLCVFDMQQGRAWLPGGAVLAPRPATPALFMPDDTVSRAELVGAAHRVLRELLGPYGFDYDKAGEQHLLRFDGGYFRVGLAVYNYPPRYEFAPVVSLRLDVAADIACALDDVAAEHRPSAASLVLQWSCFAGPGFERYVVGHTDDLCAALAGLAFGVSAGLRPLLAGCTSIADVERLANEEVDGRLRNPDPMWYASRLTLAWLAGRPDFAELGAQLLDQLHHGRMRERLTLRRLLAYLPTQDPAHPPRGLASRVDDIPGFIVRYDGSERDQFACVSNQVPGIQFMDGNEFFRGGGIL